MLSDEKTSNKEGVEHQPCTFVYLRTSNQCFEELDVFVFAMPKEASIRLQLPQLQDICRAFDSQYILFCWMTYDDMTTCFQRYFLVARLERCVKSDSTN